MNFYFLPISNITIISSPWSVYIPIILPYISGISTSKQWPVSYHYQRVTLLGMRVYNYALLIYERNHLEWKKMFHHEPWLYKNNCKAHSSLKVSWAEVAMLTSSMFLVLAEFVTTVLLSASFFTPLVDMSNCVNHTARVYGTVTMFCLVVLLFNSSFI